MSRDEAKRIVMIEDNKAFLKIMKLRLEAAGYLVFTAEDGLEGLNLAKRIVPDLIISDLVLPNMDGHKISRLLKFDERYKHIPVIMLTSRDLEEDSETARACGADAYIVKTTSAHIVMDVIARLLKRAEQETIQATES